MEVSKLFISGLLCGALALSPAKVDAMDFLKGAVVTAVTVGGAYGAAKLGAEWSGDKDTKNAVQKLECSGKSLASNAWNFFKSLAGAAASVPGAIYNGIMNAFNGKGANNAPSYLKNSKDTSYDNQNVISNKIDNKDDSYNEEGGTYDCPNPCF